MISKSLALLVINEALATGADYAEIFYEDSRAYSLSIENGVVRTSSSNSLLLEHDVRRNAAIKHANSGFIDIIAKKTFCIILSIRYSLKVFYTIINISFYS